MAGINHFYVVHENGSLYACSKGRPTKELTKQRLECPEKIEEELAGLRKDLLNSPLSFTRSSHLLVNGPSLGKYLINTNDGFGAWAFCFFYEFIWGPKNMNSY